MPTDAEAVNYEALRDCVSEPILRELSHASQPQPKRRKRRAARGRKASAPTDRDEAVERTEKQNEPAEGAPQADAEDLADFIEVCDARASNTYTSGKYHHTAASTAIHIG
jgi:hypothetical protein